MSALPLHDRAGTTCVVADDHPPIIDSLARYLGSVGFAILATALDGQKALEAVLEHRPSVCIADLNMPKLSGLELASRIASEAPETGVLLYSGVADFALVSDALDAGARGFALKDAPLEALGQAIDTVAAGSIYIDPVLGAALVTSPRGSSPRALSVREREVLCLLADGASYAEMGLALYLSPGHGASARPACNGEGGGANAHPGGRDRAS